MIAHDNGVANFLEGDFFLDPFLDNQTSEIREDLSNNPVSPFLSTVSSEHSVGLSMQPYSASGDSASTKLWWNSTSASVALNFTRVIAYQSASAVDECWGDFEKLARSSDPNSTQEGLQLLWDSLLIGSPNFDFLNKVSWCDAASDAYFTLL